MKSIIGDCPILLTMSLFSILFGCEEQKKPEKPPMEWPRFPATDKPQVQFVAIGLDHFSIKSFFIAEDKRSVYVLGKRSSEAPKKRKEGFEPRPGEFGQVDCRLFCLDTKGKIKYHKDILRTDWLDGGSFGLLEGQLLLRVGDCFLVLDPKTFAILEKIPVHDPTYVPWKETERTRDEQQADYQRQFDQLYQKATAKWLDWLPVPEYLVFVQGPSGKRSAWFPMTYEDDLLADLKKRFEPILVARNPNIVVSETGANFTITDGPSKIKEADCLSAGTQLDYPNYKNRSVLQYEMILGNKTLRFSTTDKDRHDLRLRFSDNLYLTTEDGSAWAIYEGVLYRIEK